ncbi:hypothetical protein V5799_009613 [Amblyomma americanum]|uniref:Uncharacterized protein n=1 Tax=Amblyomma americanum TaxID=6943 RepID=A0AAQ4FB71_AMBAM
MLDEERRNLHITANSLRAKEAIVQELRSALSRSATENTAPWDDRKLRKSLRVAMLTVSSLQVSVRNLLESVTSPTVYTYKTALTIPLLRFSLANSTSTSENFGAVSR